MMKPKDVTVTDAMITVGRSVLLNSGFVVPPDVVDRVYRTMRLTAPSGYRHQNAAEE